eukprot:6450244-Pyramimonas_sp.AAC.1
MGSGEAARCYHDAGRSQKGAHRQRQEGPVPWVCAVSVAHAIGKRSHHFCLYVTRHGHPAEE